MLLQKFIQISQRNPQKGGRGQKIESSVLKPLVRAFNFFTTHLQYIHRWKD